jgi:hypothetical protein
MRRTRWLIPLTLVTSACTALIGTRDLHYDPNAAQGDDGGSDGPHGGGDDSGQDAPGDTAPPCDMSKLQTDPQNCGACGHDCLGSTCVAGACQPKAIVSTNYPRYVRVDANNIYYTDGSLEGVQVMSKATGAVKSVCSTPGTGTNDLVIDATKAFFTFSSPPDAGPVGGIASCPLAGGTATVPIPNMSYPGSLIMDGTTLYWATAVGSTPEAQIWRWGGSGAPTPLATSDTATLAVLAGFLYVASDTANGKLQRCPVGGACVLQTVATDLDGIDAVTMIGNNLLWGTGVIPGTIWQGKPDGTGAVKVTVGPPVPHTFASDDKYFYWLEAGPRNPASGDSDMGAVQYCPQTGGIVDCGATGPRTLSTVPLTFVRSLVIDTNAIYWVDSSKGGGIWRVAKPL